MIIELGIYDWYQKFLMQKTQTYEHRFVNWIGYKTGKLSPILNAFKLRGRIPLITIEPKTDLRFNKNGLLQDVINGRYDKTIELIGQDIATFKYPVTIRFMHEFDLIQNASRYPWVTDDHRLYAFAFRYFVNKLREYCSEYISFIWSPSGGHLVNSFYPGGDFVDFVGCTVYNFPEWDLTYFGRVRTFKEVMDERYDNLYLFNKEIVIAEFGSTKSETQAAWVQDALFIAPYYPSVKALIYFNAPDSISWGYDLSPPDFGILTSIWKI